MVQIKKDDVRARILASARHERALGGAVGREQLGERGIQGVEVAIHGRVDVASVEKDVARACSADRAGGRAMAYFALAQ